MHNILIIYDAEDTLPVDTFRNVVMAHADFPFIRIDDIYTQANNMPDSSFNTIFAVVESVSFVIHLLRNFQVNRPDRFRIIIDSETYTLNHIQEGEMDESFGAASG